MSIPQPSFNLLQEDPALDKDYFVLRANENKY